MNFPPHAEPHDPDPVGPNEGLFLQVGNGDLDVSHDLIVLELLEVADGLGEILAGDDGVEASVHQRLEKPAVIFNDRPISYRALWERALRVAGGLRRLAFRKGIGCASASIIGPSLSRG